MSPSHSNSETCIGRNQEPRCHPGMFGAVQQLCSQLLCPSMKDSKLGGSWMDQKNPAIASLKEASPLFPLKSLGKLSPAMMDMELGGVVDVIAPSILLTSSCESQLN